jgi:hypothetical protein
MAHTHHPQLDASTPQSRCFEIGAWGFIDVLLCIGNFMFCYFLFDNLRRKTEEREFLYRRDMSELYEQYQASGADEGVRLRMVNRHMNYVASVREANAKIEADRAKLAALQGMLRAYVCVCVFPCVCVAIIRSF